MKSIDRQFHKKHKKTKNPQIGIRTKKKKSQTNGRFINQKNQKRQRNHHGKKNHIKRRPKPTYPISSTRNIKKQQKKNELKSNIKQQKIHKKEANQQEEKNYPSKKTKKVKF